MILLFSEDQGSGALPAAAEFKQVMKVQFIGTVLVTVHTDPALSHQPEDALPLRQFIKAKFNFITFFSSHVSPFGCSKQLLRHVFLYKCIPCIQYVL